MKTKLLLPICLSLVLFCACDNQPQDQPSTEIRTGDAAATPGAGMVIVKFANSKQLEYVVASNTIKKYDGPTGRYVYDENGSLGLNIADGTDTYLTFNSAEHSPFFENELQLLGTSPYIHLGMDYYLVDWKWQQLLPISATCNYPQPDRGDILDAIQNHCYLTNTKWKDLSAVSTRWAQSNNFPAILVREVYRLNIKAFEKYLGADTSGRPEFLCYNFSLYGDGLSVSNVMAYWFNRYNSGCHPQNAYLDCIAYYDSLQNVYVNALTKIITQEKLDQIPLSR